MLPLRMEFDFILSADDGISGERLCLAEFLDQEDDPIRVVLHDLDAVASLKNEMRKIDRRERIGTDDFEPIARLQGFQGLASPQHRQGTF